MREETQERGPKKSQQNFGYRGIVTGIYTTNSPEACHYVAYDSKTNIMVVENWKQLDKIMQIWNRSPHLKAVVLYKDSIPERCPNLYMVTWTSAHCSRAGDKQPAEVQQESIVSYLPLSHITAQIYDLWTGIKRGEQVYFAEPDYACTFSS